MVIARGCSYLMAAPSVTAPSAVDRLLSDVAALSAFGEKLPGTRAEAAACGHIAAELARLGVVHEVHEFEAFIGWPIRSEVVVGAERFAANGIAFGADSGPAGVTGKLADGGRDGFAGMRLDGRIVVVDGMPRHGVLHAATQAGAAGVIAVSSGLQRHFVSASPLWGAPVNDADLAMLPGIPAVQVSRPDGEALRARCAVGLVEATLVAETRKVWRPVRMPVAHIPGREDGFLLVGAHLCTWAQGATDNAAGAALLLELARRYAAGPRPRYGLRLAWWTGHEQGAYAGSSWYADHAWQDLHRHAIGYLNVDIVGSTGATTKAVRNTSAELAKYVTATVARVAGPLPPAEDAFVRHALRRADACVDPRRPARNSDQSFLGIGLPSLQVSAFLPAASPDHLPDSGLAWWWQTEQDTPDRCDPAVLAVDMDVHHALVEGLIDAPCLPLDVAAMEGDMLAALREYAQAAPDLDALADLARLAQTFGDAARRLRAFRGDPAELDAIQLHVTRTLNPVLFHASSAFEHDPGRVSRLLPGLAPALTLTGLEHDAACMARVALRRQANRVAHALQAATSAVEDFLHRANPGA